MIINRRGITFLFSLFVVIAAGIYLASHKVPAPEYRVEKVISNDRFFK